jgi:hypothetical protein
MEVLVSFGLLLLATGMMVALFVPSMSLFRRQTGKSDSYRGCLMMMEKFRVGLLNAQMETLTIAADGKAVSWQLVQEDPPFSGTSGDPLMSPDFGVIFYQAAEQKVYYKTYHDGSSAGPDRPAVLDLPELGLACNSNSPETRVLAQNIVEFQIEDKNGNVTLLEPPIRLTIKCEIDTKGTETNDVEAYQLTTSVSPRSMRW